MNERMTERVQTLLDQAEGFRRHGEDGSADAALNLAEKIMMRWSIDQATLTTHRDATTSDESIVQRRVLFTGIYRKAIRSGIYDVANAFGTVRTFYTSDGNVDTLHVIGYESDVTQLTLLTTSLQMQAVDGMNHWWQNYPDRQHVKGMLGYKTRRQYIISFMKGVVERVTRSRKTSIDESGTALVVADRRRVVDAYMQTNFNLVTRHSQTKAGLPAAADAGLSAGRRAATGETTVNGGRRQLTR